VGTPELSERSRQNRPPFFRFHGALSHWVRPPASGHLLGEPLPACAVLAARRPAVARVLARSDGPAGGLRKTAEFAVASRESPIGTRPSAHV